jgi:hypothetical protein
MNRLILDVITTDTGKGAVMVYPEGSPELTTVMTFATFEEARTVAYAVYGAIHDAEGKASLRGYGKKEWSIG